MSIISTSDFGKGVYIMFRGEICQITDKEFVNPGKGGAFSRIKLKNIKTGYVTEFTYKSGEKVESPEVNVVEMSYLYNDGNDFYFMNPKNYEQSSLPKDMVGRVAKYLKEGEICQILVHDEQPLSLRPPKKIRLKVIESEDAVAGSTVNGAQKMITLETGATVMAPLFIKEGETVVVDTETDSYVERA